MAELLRWPERVEPMKGKRWITEIWKEYVAKDMECTDGLHSGMRIEIYDYAIDAYAGWSGYALIVHSKLDTVKRHGYFPY